MSDLVRDTVPDRLRGRTEVVVHGVDLDGRARRIATATVCGPSSGSAPDEIVFGTVANFRAQKDYPNLLAAAVVLRDRGVPVRIVAVGSGSARGGDAGRARAGSGSPAASSCSVSGPTRSG